VSRYPAVVVLAAAAAVVCTACRSKPPGPPVTSIRIGVGAPQGIAGTGAEAFIRTLVRDPWLTNMPDGRFTDRIATRAEWRDGGLTLRLTLRRGVFFHDSTELTPQLAAECLREVAADPDRAPLSFGSVASVDASGPDTVDIRLKERNGFVLNDLSSVLVTKPGDVQIGTGPFRILTRQDKDVSLAAFGRYYRGQPGLARIEMTNYTTQRKAWTAMMRGEIDMLYEVSRDAVEFVEAESTVKTYSFLRPYYIPLVFNVRHPILKRVEVRKAINEALNRAVLVRDGMNGRGRPSDGPISPLHWAYAPTRTPFVYSPESARQRLDRAGLKEKPAADGTLPARFSFTCLFFADDTRFDRLAALIQQELAEVGIDMKLQPVEQKVLGPRLAAGDFDAFLFEMAGRSLDWVYELWRSHDGSLLNSGYRSADAILDRIRSGLSDDEIRADVAALDRIMHDDPPAAFIAWQSTTRAVSAGFDVAAEKDRDIAANVWLWRPADAAKLAAR
jgi:ABC-type transport system substrate-binding protein